MAIETVQGDEYTVAYDDASQYISLAGTIRLQTSEEYEPMVVLLRKAYAAVEPGGTVCLDFTQLRFLNSSGINTISRFVITARKEDRAHLRIIGSQEIYWQQKSLSNLQKLWPDVQIEIQ
jgi:hypothetical protein